MSRFSPPFHQRLVRAGAIWTIAITVVSAQEPTFDVATIKARADNAPIGRYQDGPELYARPSNNLIQLVAWAYDVPIYNVVGGPSWAESVFWDVEAKTTAGKSEAQLHQMLQSLLGERFQLKVHWETRDAPAFELSLSRRDGRLGPNLRRSSLDCEPVIESRWKTDDQALLSACRGLTRRSSTKTSIDMKGVALTRLATVVAGHVHAPVTVAPSLLAERFDLSVYFQSAIYARQTLGVDNSDVPTVQQALQEQLGLRLNSSRRPIRFLVIDSAERPSQN